MQNATKFFDTLKGDMMGKVYTADIGIVDNINGDLLDVNVEGYPLLINVPQVKSAEATVGDNVIVVFVKSSISNAVVVGVL